MREFKIGLVLFFLVACGKGKDKKAEETILFISFPEDSYDFSVHYLNKEVEIFLKQYCNKDLCPEDFQVREFWTSLRLKFPRNDFTLVSLKDEDIKSLYEEIYDGL